MDLIFSTFFECWDLSLNWKNTEVQFGEFPNKMSGSVKTLQECIIQSLSPEDIDVTIRSFQNYHIPVVQQSLYLHLRNDLLRNRFERFVNLWNLITSPSAKEDLRQVWKDLDLWTPCWLQLGQKIQHPELNNLVYNRVIRSGLREYSLESNLWKYFPIYQPIVLQALKDLLYPIPIVLGIAIQPQGIVVSDRYSDSIEFSIGTTTVVYISDWPFEFEGQFNEGQKAGRNYRHPDVGVMSVYFELEYPDNVPIWNALISGECIYIGSENGHLVVKTEDVCLTEPVRGFPNVESQKPVVLLSDDYPIF